MLNDVKLIGHAVREAQVFEKNGNKFAVTTLAVDNSYTNKNGQKVEDVLFIDIYFFNGYVEVAKKYIAKGKKLLVDGSLKMKPYKTQHGDNAQKTYIVVENIEFLSPKNVVQSESSSEKQKQQVDEHQETPNYEAPHNEDEIPF